MNFLFADNPATGADTALALLRLTTGTLMAYHGLEALDAAKMAEYATWDVIKNLPAGGFMVALGKWIELIAGIGLAAGLFTRLSAISIAAVMAFITFKVGGGRFWYEDQHPFLFVLLALVWFFIGGGPWSMDRWWKKLK
jgi:putative oxidoreductase